MDETAIIRSREELQNWKMKKASLEEAIQTIGSKQGKTLEEEFNKIADSLVNFKKITKEYRRIQKLKNVNKEAIEAFLDYAIETMDYQIRISEQQLK